MWVSSVPINANVTAPIDANVFAPIDVDIAAVAADVGHVNADVFVPLGLTAPVDAGLTAPDLGGLLPGVGDAVGDVGDGVLPAVGDAVGGVGDASPPSATPSAVS